MSLISHHNVAHICLPNTFNYVMAQIFTVVFSRKCNAKKNLTFDESETKSLPNHCKITS